MQKCTGGDCWVSKVHLSKGYTVPKTSAQLDTVHSEDDAQQAPRARNNVRTCSSEDTVWWLTECSQGCTFEASDDDFTTPFQALCCVLIPGKHLTAFGRGYASTSQGAGWVQRHNSPTLGQGSCQFTNPGARVVPIGCPRHHR